MRLQGDLRAFNIGLVFPVYVRRYRLEARKAGQSQDLAKPMKLDNRFNPIAALRAAPGLLRQLARVKVRIDRHIVAEALGRSKERLQFAWTPSGTTACGPWRSIPAGPCTASLTLLP